MNRRALIDGCGVSAAELAAGLGVPAVSVERWLSGDRVDAESAEVLDQLEDDARAAALVRQAKTTAASKERGRRSREELEARLRERGERLKGPRRS